MSKKWLVFTSLFAFITSASASLPISFEIDEVNRTLTRLNLNDTDIKVSSKSSSMISYNDLPLDVLVQIVQHLEKNNVINFRGVSLTLAKAVESFIPKASFIKSPLNCLTDKKIKHPYPHTISHFMRDHLRNIFNNVPQTDETYKSLIKFSSEWNYKGKDILEAFEEKNSDKITLTILKYLTDTTDNPDLRELQLLLRIRCFQLNLILNSTGFPLNDLLSTAYAMPDLEKKEIASPHLFSFAYSLSEKSQLEVIKELYKFCANQGHQNAQNNLGVIYCNENNIIEAKKYFKLLADQGVSPAQCNLGIIFKNEENIAEATKYWQLAADQGHVDAQNYLGAIFYEKGDMIKATKYWQLAADQGHADAQNLSSGLGS